jgi:hypothetical protein
MSELPPICSWCAKAIRLTRPIPKTIDGHQEAFHDRCYVKFLEEQDHTEEQRDE